MKKRVLMFFLVMVLLIVNKSYAKVYKGTEYYSITTGFSAGALDESTEVMYQTSKFLVDIISKNGKKIVTEREMFVPYDEYSGGDINEWRLSVTPEKIVEGWSDGKDILKEIYKEGATIYLKPRFQFLHLDSLGYYGVSWNINHNDDNFNKKVTKTNKSTGVTKEFYICPMDCYDHCDATTIRNASPVWAQAGNTTGESFAKQYFYIDVPAHNHTPVCRLFGKLADEHPHTYNNKEYELLGEEYWKKCSDCGQYTELDCKAKDEIIIPPPPPPSTPTPGDCEHWHNYTVPELNPPSNSSQSLTASMNPGSPPYLFKIGDDFTLNIRRHINVSVTADLIVDTLYCGTRTCDKCGEEYTCPGHSYETYTNFSSRVEYKGATIEFKGFRVGTSKSDTSTVGAGSGGPFDRERYASEFVDDAKDSSRYRITEIIPSELEYDSDGHTKGKVIVRCNCGSRSCTKTFQVYFDLIPNSNNQQYNLSVLSEEEGKYGFVGINVDDPTEASVSSKILEGNSVNIVAKAKPGYKFDYWEDINTGIKVSKDAITSIIMPGRDYTLVARFKPADTYRVEIYSDGNGTAKVGDKEGHRLYIDVSSGSNLTIEAIPDPDFEVDVWEVLKGKPIDKNKDPSLVLENIQEDYIIFLKFKYNGSNFYILTVDKHGEGTVIGGTKYAIPGKEYPITAIPDDGHRFLYWKDDGAKILPIGALGYVEMPNRHYTVTAWFDRSAPDIYYDLTVRTDGGGEVSIDNRDPVPDKDTISSKNGEEHKIKAEPDDGYEFKGWNDGDGNPLPLDKEDYVRVDEDKEYVALFEFVGYKLEALSAGNGFVQIDNMIMKSYDILEGIRKGEAHVIKAYPDSCYKFDFWWNEKDKIKEKGKKVDDHWELSVNVEESEKYTAYFVYDGGHKLTVKSDGGGEVSIDNRPSAPDKDTITVKPGTEHVIHANPDPGNEFEEWTDSKGKEDPPKSKDATIIVNEDKDYTAHFNENGEYTLTLKSKTNGLVSIGEDEPTLIEVSTKVKKGEKIKINSQPSDGFVFSSWREEGKDTPLEYGEDDEIVMPERDYTLIVTFIPDEWCEIDVWSASKEGGLISIDDGEEKLEDSVNKRVGEKVKISAHPNDGWSFAYWLNSEDKIVSYEPIYEVTVNKSEEYIAYFIKDGSERYKLEVRSNGNGTVSGTVNDAIPGNEYRIKAKPDSGYKFDYWKDIDNKDFEYRKDSVDNGKVIGWVLMQERDMILKAYFNKSSSGGKDEYTVTVNTDEGGENPIVNNESGEIIVDAGEDVTIDVTVKDGYKFIGWYEGNNKVYSNKTQTFQPKRDITLTAKFKKVTPHSGTIDTFKILSIRDIRWMDYFSGGGNYLELPSYVDENSDLVNSAKLINSKFNKYRDIVYGYAVEFEMKITGIPKDQVELVIKPTIHEKKNNGDISDNALVLQSTIHDQEISSKDANDVKHFLISSKEVTRTLDDGSSITYPEVTWNWVYYLPIDVYNDIVSKVEEDSNIVIKLDISLRNSTGKSIFNYAKSVNALRGAIWNGNAFTYRLRDKDGKQFTLINDIYDNATN